MNETRAPTNEEIRAQVLEDYQNGEKPKALAEKTGISINTIKSWIKRDKARKASAGKDASQSKKGASPNKKKGAPVGNKNAKGNRGGAAPLRNHNAEKHGAYSKVYWDTLDDEEFILIDSMDDDAELHLISQLQMFSVRERRLMQRIRQYKEVDEKNHGLAVKSVSEKKVVEDVVNSKGEPIGDGKFKKSSEMTVTNTEAVINSIMTLEAELTKIQRAKTKAIETLSKLRLEKTRMKSESAGDDAVDDWIAAVIGEAVESYE